MIESHIDQKALEQKIKELFEYRMFPKLFEIQEILNPIEVSEFSDRLIDLQKSIYYLDAHLESHWDVNQEVLSWHWQHIEVNLARCLSSNVLKNNYLDHIRRYEYHELSLRKGKNLLDYNLEFFYFYKSCDVKLIRRLIYEKCKLSKYLGPLSIWRYFDLVTEVNDDVVDVFEDLDFINGNIVLLSMMSEGKDATLSKFFKFLDDIHVQAKLAFQTYKKSDIHDEIMLCISNQVIKTKYLLDENLQKLHIDKSILYHILKTKNIISPTITKVS